MAIRDYFVIYLRSAITKLNQKTMAIDRNKSCITIIAAGSREDRDDRVRIARITAGSSEIKWNVFATFFYISAVYGPIFKRFSAKWWKYTLEYSPCVKLGSNIFYFFFMLRITAFPHLFLSLYICFKCKSTWGLQSQLHLLSLFICKYIQADWSMLRIFWISRIVERQNGKRGLESGFGSAGYANGIWMQILEEDGMVHKFWYLVMSECGA